MEEDKFLCAEEPDDLLSSLGRSASLSGAQEGQSIPSFRPKVTRGVSGYTVLLVFKCTRYVRNRNDVQPTDGWIISL